MKFAFCSVSIAPLRAEKRDASEMVSQLLFGELFQVAEVDNNWTKIITFSDHYEAWMDTKHVIYLSEKEAFRWLDVSVMERAFTRAIKTPWGLQTLTRGALVGGDESDGFKIGRDEFQFATNEIESFSGDYIAFAKSYLNAPYLWGGKSPFGIDCSGFTQQVFRFREINLPRDAYQQADLGMNVEFSERQAGDLAFFNNASGKITHVGLILKDLRIIHASGRVKIDELTPAGILNELGERTHVLHSIKRM